MNRRTFTQVMTAAALSAAVPPLPATAQSGAASPKAPPFPLSVMLWTVFNDLPFEQRLAKVAEAGYSKIELVGEYNAQNWSPADFARANAARKSLGIEFDATAGMKHGIADPSVRDAFLAELSKRSSGPRRWWRAARSTASRCGCCWNAFIPKKIRNTFSPRPPRPLKWCAPSITPRSSFSMTSSTSR